ncbi:MAG: transcriptional regulator [Oscillospiraceae bacterium]|nr:transcriptional regulator [Oscillospiraceae bacterium]
MNRAEFIAICDRKVKLVRAEHSFSQERMAYILGISKKTLVEIEKGRSSLGWTGSAALCAIFGDSEVIASSFGGRPTEIILALAFEGGEPLPAAAAAAGRIWWQTVSEAGGYTIQQNIISQHYRLTDSDGRRVASSFNLEDLQDFMTEE